MRLPAEKIKEAMLHPDQSVREAAIYCLADVHSHDPAIMSLAIQAFERYGLDAFSSFSVLNELAQTSESILWLVKEIEHVGESTEEKEINFAASAAEGAASERYRFANAALRHHSIHAASG